MQNLSYEISEKSRTNIPVNIDTLMTEMATVNYESEVNVDDITYALTINYSTNHNVKQLGMILDYYNIPKRGLRKDDMVQYIVSYEVEPTNLIHVEQRKRMWNHVVELKQDKFFSKYLIIDL